MPDAAWKHAERRICTAFGGVRRGPDGVGQSDCVGTKQAVQVKRSQRGVPLGRWIAETKAQGKKEHKDWVLVVIKPGQQVENATAVVELGFLLNLLSAYDSLMG